MSHIHILEEPHSRTPSLLSLSPVAATSYVLSPMATLPETVPNCSKCSDTVCADSSTPLASTQSW